MKECCKKCVSSKKACEQNKCRMWIDFEKDLNCALISIQSGGLTQVDISNRLKISPARVCQIEKTALIKVAEAFLEEKV